MYVLSLEITKSCNLQCSYCYVGEKKQKNMDWYVAKKAIDVALHEAHKQYDKQLRVYFIGGEPLIAFRLIKDCIHYIELENLNYNLKITYSMTTNGTLFDREKVEYLIEKRFQLKISLDGGMDVQDLNRVFSGGRGSYKTVVEGLKYKEEIEKRTGRLVHAAQLINKNTCDKFADSLRNLYELGFKYIETEINAYETWESEKKKVLIEQIDKAFKFYIKSRNNGERWVWRYYEDMLEGFVSTDLPFFPCKAGLTSLFVTVKGQFYPCMETKKCFQIGDVEKGIDAESVRQLIRINKSKNQKCLICKEYKENRCSVCSCLIGNLEHTGNCFIPAEITCETTKHINDFFRKIYSDSQISLLEEHYRKERRKEKYV